MIWRDNNGIAFLVDAKTAMALYKMRKECDTCQCAPPEKTTPSHKERSKTDAPTVPFNPVHVKRV